MKSLIALSAALALAVVVVAPAAAGKSRPTATTSKTTLSVSNGTSPGTPATTVGSTFTLYGCGDTKLTTLEVWHDYSSFYFEVTPDAKGCVSATFNAFSPSATGSPTGSYIGQSWQKQAHGWVLSQ